jgi:hypothetical protein
MADRTVADDRLAFDHVSHDGDFVIREQHANTFADRRGIAADCDKVSVAAGADGDVACETQDAISV